MSSHRWDPWGDIAGLREAMSSLLEESFIHPGRSGVGLAVDVLETPDRYEIYGSAPGMGPEDIDITVLGDTVRIRGERPPSLPQEDDDARWLIRERHAGGFERTITLPTAVQADAASAEFRDGVLTVRLPKAEQSRARSIPVLSGERSEAPQAIDVPVPEKDEERSSADA